MGLIEAILIGIQSKRPEKLIVFLSMLICFLAFCVLGVLIVLAGAESLVKGNAVLPSLGLASFSVLFFGLAAICGRFIKRSVR